MAYATNKMVFYKERRMDIWILILWLTIERGGGPLAAEFSSKERCEAAGNLVLASKRYTGNARFDNIGNFVCAPK